MWFVSASGLARGAENSDLPDNSSVGKEIANLVLPDATSDKQVALTDFGGKKAVALFFMGTSCPIANLYVTEMQRLQEQYAAQGLQVVGIYAAAGVTREEVAEHVKEFKVTLPVLLDEKQQALAAVSATRMAEVVLLDEHRVVRYHGRIDDRFNYTYKKNEPRRADLEEALKELLEGKEISVAATKPYGCLITRVDRPKADHQVTFAKDVAKIIQTRCHECHRPGMVGPFALMDHDDVAEWSAMIKEVVTQRRMPPWHADPRHGQFSNNRRMPQEEIDTLVSWIDSGMPFGDQKDLPPTPEYAEGWVIDKPDVVFQLPDEVTIPATGVVPYQHYTVPTNFKEDVWVTQAEARPNNRAVVHHIIVFCRDPKKGAVRRGDGLGDNFITGTAPGDPPTILPPGVALKIPAGSDLIFQMHYTPTGKEEKDRSEVGLVFSKGDKPPERTAHTKGIMNVRFAIPPGDASYRVESSFTFKRDALVLNFMPHMHLRGKDFLFEATYPDGKQEVLLSVPSYDFNWQNKYILSEPKLIPNGTTIHCVAHFDNSTGNPANPDPKETVRWGDQTWEEMMIGWRGYVWTYPHAAGDTEGEQGEAAAPPAGAAGD